MVTRAFQGTSPHCGSHVFIDPTALILGNVSIGQDSSVWPMAVIRGDLLSIQIGGRTNIQDHAIFHTTHASEFNPGGHALSIGHEVTIGHRVTLHGCTIGDRCLIGMGSIILDGVVIEPESMIAAGSLLSPGKVVHSGWLWMGSPARPKRELTADEKRFLRYSAENYVRLKNLHLAAVSSASY